MTRSSRPPAPRCEVVDQLMAWMEEAARDSRLCELKSERANVERLRDETPDSDVLDRSSFESRISAIDKEIEQVQAGFSLPIAPRVPRRTFRRRAPGMWSGSTTRPNQRLLRYPGVRHDAEW